MKTTRSLQIAAIIIAAGVTAAASIVAAKPTATSTIMLPQVIVTAHRLPVHQLATVTVTGKRLHADEKTRIAAVAAVIAAS